LFSTVFGDGLTKTENHAVVETSTPLHRQQEQGDDGSQSVFNILTLTSKQDITIRKFVMFKFIQEIYYIGVVIVKFIIVGELPFKRTLRQQKRGAHPTKPR
jgi:hypothetical protein